MSLVMRLERLAGCVLSALLFAGLNCSAAGQDVQQLSPDLSFHFVCNNGFAEARAESFLIDRGFKVLNLGEIRRQHGMPPFDTKIVALDSSKRLIEITSAPGKDERYAFYVYSEPPTRHSTLLEDDALKFFSQEIGCETRQIARNQNSEQSKHFYESEVKRIEKLFIEAGELRGARRI